MDKSQDSSNSQEENTSNPTRVSPADYWENTQLPEGCKKSSHSVHHSVYHDDEEDD